MNEWLFISCSLLFLALIFAKTELMALVLLASCLLMRFPGATKNLELYRIIFASAVLIIWLLKKMAYSQISDRYRFHYNTLTLPIVAITFLLIISYIQSMDVLLSRRYFIVHLICFGSLFMFCDLCSNNAFRRKVVICLFAMGIITSLVAILQYLIMQFNLFLPLENLAIPEMERREFVEEAGFNLLAFRSMGTFGHPNLLAMFLAMLFPLGMTLAAYSAKKIEKSILLFSLLAFAVAVYCSNSRGGILNILIGLAFILAVDMKKMYRIFIILSISAVIIFCLFSKEAIEYMRLQHALSYRNIIWENSIDLFLKKPFLGYGLGAFGTEYLKVFGMFSVESMETAVAALIYYGGIASQALFLPAMAGLSAHNLFLNYAVEIGFLGPILLIWFYMAYFKWAFRQMSLNDKISPYTRPFILGVTAAVLGNFVHNFFEATTMFSVLSIGMPFMAVISLALTQSAVYQEGQCK